MADNALPVYSLGDCPYGAAEEFWAEIIPQGALPNQDPRLIEALLQRGYRRNGGMWYRPRCQGCTECVALRVVVAEFRPRRDQARCLRHNHDLNLSWHERGCDDERCDLHQRYQAQVHGPDSVGYTHELHLEGDCPGGELHARDAAGRLLAVSILDRSSHGLSSVYCYFDPSQRRRSLGSFMILAEIAHCQQLGLPWLYLGFTVRSCGKMAYKARFGPHQILRNGEWQAGGTAATQGAGTDMRPPCPPARGT